MRARRPSVPSCLAAAAAFGASALVVELPRPAHAFGDVGAFEPRLLLAGGTDGAARPTAPGRWATELVQRTSAPARARPGAVRADDPRVTDAPFLYWSGAQALQPLTSAEISGLRRFFSLGGTLLVDDAAPGDGGATGTFGESARRELRRVLPESPPIALGADHVVYRSFYLVHRPEGRVQGPRALQAIVRGGRAQVLFVDADLGGALARGVTGAWEMPVVPGGDAQRERAVRLAVNVAMYVLCSNYKDDQVHAPFLMRRRASGTGDAP